jgi:single-stranded-DNA-specific exonuclease
MAIFHTEPQCVPAERRSLTGTRWHITPPSETAPLGVPPAIGQLLAARGIAGAAEAQAFLHPTLSALADPYLLPDMAEAVAAIDAAVTRGAPIRIFGDYDADGITSTAVLVRALQALGGQVDWYLPHRVEDGYGLNDAALEQARAEGVDLGITVDNGISAHAQLAHAEQLGLRMIVTDHHEPGATLPSALAVLNPKRADSAYPFRELAGVGVAFTLLRALCQARGLAPNVPMRFLDLVTVGTIADVVPLVGENRVLVSHGLPLLTPASKKAGLAALLRAIGVRERASCGDVGFQLAPRLNAAGRIAHAADALRLLLTTDAAEAETLAAQLCAHNTQRQDEEAHTLDEALALTAACDLTREKALVLASPHWHPGVVGIVASRLLERFHRPVALIALQDGVGKGSARARAPFHLWEALDASSHLLRRFGGHRVAAGFEVSEENIPALRAALCAIADRTLSDDDLLPSLEIDAWLDLTEVTTGFARDVEALAPFGMGNPTPIFAAQDVLVQQVCPRGADGSHLSLSLRSGPGNSRPLSAIWFRRGEHAAHLRPGMRIDIAFNVGLNCWQGITTAQLVVKDIME